MRDVLIEHIPTLAGMAALLSASGFFSASESAIFSIAWRDLEQLRADAGRRARAALALHADRNRLIITILFGNMVVNILFFSLSAELAFTMRAESLSAAAVGGFAVLALFAMILFGEIFPKTIALSSPTGFSKFVSLPLFAFHQGLKAIRFVSMMERISGFFERRLSSENSAHLPANILSAVELEHALDLSSDLSSTERDLLRRVVNLETVAVRERMTPRPQIAYATIHSTPAEALALAATRTFHDLPVVGDGLDDIRGFVTIDDLFSLSKTGATSLGGMLKRFRHLPETLPASDVLRQMSDEKFHTAVVVDEYGQTAGIITLEDCLEGIFGEMSDEYDSDIDLPASESDRYVFAGDLSVREWTDACREPLLKIGFDHEPILNDDFDTMSGLIVKQLQRLPAPGDRATLGDVTFFVKETNAPGKGTPVKRFECRWHLAAPADVGETGGSNRRC